jgi:hypothetical protein
LFYVFNLGTSQRAHIGVKKIKPSLLHGIDEWQLLNMPTKDVFDLIARARGSVSFGDEVANCPELIIEVEFFDLPYFPVKAVQFIAFQRFDCA